MKHLITSSLLILAAASSACGNNSMKQPNNLPKNIPAEFSAFQTGNGGKVLSCICHGGPGNYSFACDPIQKICHGGPGDYSYPCEVCPE